MIMPVTNQTHECFLGRGPTVNDNCAAQVGIVPYSW